MKRHLLALALAACSQSPGPQAGAPAGVVFTYPVDHQLDVPTGARIVVSFADPIGAGDLQLAGPAGIVAVTGGVASGGKTVTLTPDALDPGTTYDVISDGEPLFGFTTRSDRPRSGAPRLIAINGSDPATPGAFRPIVETSTIELVFSEPLDPRSIAIGPGAIELVDASNVAVPVRLLAGGIHASLDPIAPLVANGSYELRLGAQLRDSSGEVFVPTTVPFVPVDSLGRGGNVQTLRTRQDGDPIPALARLDVQNVIELSHPLIGTVSSAMKPGAMASELGDPSALGGPIAFTIPRGQRLSSSALDILLAGTIPSGLDTGDIQIELVSDCNGRIYRNRYRPDALPDNDASPLYVDLTLDLGVFATDPAGNAVLAETVLGVQVAGLAMADDGVLAIEVLGAMDVALLGIATAPTNLVLDLVTDPSAQVARDDAPPELVSSAPEADSHELSPEAGLELVFSEPIDLERARAGGIVLVDGAGHEVPSALELHGSVVVVRPRALLADGEVLRVTLRDVADVAGNAMTPRAFSLATPTIVATDAPLSVVSASPGTACALVDPGAGSPGRCAGGQPGDDHYHPFALGAGEAVEVVFDRAVDPRSLVLGAACATGSVRVEHLDPEGRCLAPVAGSLVARPRGLAFTPDAPWIAGDHYRAVVVSGPDATCNPGEICGADGRAASFDPVAGKTAKASGGPDLTIDFVGAAPITGTRLVAGAAPFSDLNASGRIEAGEQPRDENRAALRIAGTSGLITSATFSGPDCVPSTPELEACMYMLGTMPVEIGRAMQDCALPDGTTAPSCIPVMLSAQQLYATSVAMTAAALGIGIATETGLSVMRIREPATGPPQGFIVDRDGTPTMIVALELYMDAPDMAIPLATHDLHSKPLSVLLSGPVTFRPDGRIAIALRNTAELAIAVGINAPLGITGSVALVVPANEMKLQLLSPPLRGSLR